MSGRPFRKRNTRFAWQAAGVMALAVVSWVGSAHGQEKPPPQPPPSNSSTAVPVVLAIDKPAEALAALERGQALDPHNWDIHNRIEQTRAKLNSRVP